MQEVHDTLFGGHLGHRKTLAALQQRVWWPKMDGAVRAFVAGCPICQKVKDRTTGQPGELHPLPIPEGRFEAWSMDFIFGLPESGGYTGVMTCVDRLSKLVRLTPCNPDVTAEGAAALFFDRVVRDFGVPKTVVSDRDPRFVSAFWKALMSSLGTKLMYSTAFHPQTDG